MDQALKSKLQLYFVNSFKNLNNSTKNVHRLLKIVDFIVKSAIDENDSSPAVSDFQLEFKEFSKSNIRSEFYRNFYSTCLSQLLTNFNPNLTTNIEGNENFSSAKDLFLAIISNARFSDTFNVIYDMCLSLRFNFAICFSSIYYNLTCFILFLVRVNSEIFVCF